MPLRVRAGLSLAGWVLAAVALSYMPGWAAVINRSHWSGVAIEGYDPVAYFTDGKAVAGSPQFEADWQGVTWRFANRGNLEAFEAAPEVYAPRFGGYCASGVARGVLADIDPTAFAIVGNRLYLMSSHEVLDAWRAEMASAIALAREEWAHLQHRVIR